MKKAKKILIGILIVLVSIAALPFLAFGALLLFVPISRPDDAVLDYVSKKIPVGTSWDDTITEIEENNWIIKETRTDRGLRINDGAGNAYFASENEMLNGSDYPDRIRIVGEKSMFVELGEFYGPFHTAVFVYMAFDENDELIEMSVRRDIDSL